jgi:hypothetical protein
MSALNQENKITPDALHKSGQDLSVAESLNIDFPEPVSVTFANLFC